MLTKDLVAVRRARGKVVPRFVDPDSPAHRELAERVIGLFREHVGKRRFELHRALEGLETHTTFKLVRGLAQLLEREAVFETRAKVDPQLARERLFAPGYVTSPEERARRLEEVARELSRELGIELPPQDLEEAIRADREEHQVLRGFRGARGDPEAEPHPPWGPEALLRQYNLSLAQTLLFDALDLVFEVSGAGEGEGAGAYRPIFGAIKRLGLMYEAVEERPGRVRVRVDGPASLLKETTKYGTAFAKLLPRIVRAPRFRLQARLLLRDRVRSRDGEGSRPQSQLKPRHYTFELDSTKRSLFPLEPAEGAEGGVEEEEVRFDSAVERDFYRRIQAVMPEWRVLREPGPLRAGAHVFLPDFGFARSEGPKEVEQYLEIVGFWTPEYLRKKLRKLREVEAPLLIAVDEGLVCSEATREQLAQLQEQHGKEVFLYKRRLPLEPVVERLLERGRAHTAREVARLRGEGEGLWARARALLAERGRLSLPELAAALGVGPEALRRLLPEGLAAGRLPGFSWVGEALVSEERLAQARRELEALLRGKGKGKGEKGKGIPLGEALEVLERCGLGESAFEALGFRVERASLLEARVVKASERTPTAGSD